MRGRRCILGWPSRRLRRRRDLLLSLADFTPGGVRPATIIIIPPTLAGIAVARNVEFLRIIAVGPTEEIFMLFIAFEVFSKEGFVTYKADFHLRLMLGGLHRSNPSFGRLDQVLADDLLLQLFGRFFFRRPATRDRQTQNNCSRTNGNWNHNTPLLLALHWVQ